MEPEPKSRSDVVEFWQVVGVLGEFMNGSSTFDNSASSEGRYRLLVESISDYAIYMLDPSGIVANWNAGAQRFKGYTAQEIVG